MKPNIVTFHFSFGLAFIALMLYNLFILSSSLGATVSLAYYCASMSLAMWEQRKINKRNQKEAIEAVIESEQYDER